MTNLKLIGLNILLTIITFLQVFFIWIFFGSSGMIKIVLLGIGISIVFSVIFYFSTVRNDNDNNNNDSNNNDSNNNSIHNDFNNKIMEERKLILSKSRKKYY